MLHQRDRQPCAISCRERVQQCGVRKPPLFDHLVGAGKQRRWDEPRHGPALPNLRRRGSQARRLAASGRPAEPSPRTAMRLLRRRVALCNAAMLSPLHARTDILLPHVDRGSSKTTRVSQLCRPALGHEHACRLSHGRCKCLSNRTKQVPRSNAFHGRPPIHALRRLYLVCRFRV